MKHLLVGPRGHRTIATSLLIAAVTVTLTGCTAREATTRTADSVPAETAPIHLEPAATETDETELIDPGSISITGVEPWEDTEEESGWDGIDSTGTTAGDTVIMGSVVDSDGRPLAGVTMEIRAFPTKAVQTTTTMADGSYAFNPGAGTYQVFALVPDRFDIILEPVDGIGSNSVSVPPTAVSNWVLQS
ncbi:carboxypeptidase-like regulatory domain-containing protein [Nucisporomicrobium flavum]|uniref:carboxypeptidase-like regulatory domain-containing protein n=1 Tax=Nucisporomicrobium flavum TaxID=2785915 RepID=UPI0018F5029D|nr:carboxypeptidase-like regulatory domain-containing protein [Nucisporomicrobium flavum]